MVELKSFYFASFIPFSTNQIKKDKNLVLHHVKTYVFYLWIGILKCFSNFKIQLFFELATDSAGILALEQNALHKNIVIAALFFIAVD